MNVSNTFLSIPTSKRSRRGKSARKPLVSSSDAPSIVGSIVATTTGSISMKRGIHWVNDDGTPQQVQTVKPGFLYYKVRSSERQPFVAWLKKMAAVRNQEVAGTVQDLKLRFCTIPKDEWKGWYNCFARLVAKERAERVAQKRAEREAWVREQASIVAQDYRNKNYIVPAVVESNGGRMTGTTFFPTTAAVHVKYYPRIREWVERVQAYPNTGDLILEDGTVVWKKFLQCWVDHWLSRMQKKHASCNTITIQD